MNFFGYSSSNSEETEPSYSSYLSNVLHTITDNTIKYAYDSVMASSQQLNTSSDEISKKEILYVSFNQDGSCIGIGHEDGYMFYSFLDVDSLMRIEEGKRSSDDPNAKYYSEAPKRICIVERLFRSSLVGLVSMNQTRKLWIYHSQKNNEICANTFSNAILSVRMNRKRIVVCLEDLISIHNVRDMRQLHKITDTPLNPKGIMDLSNDENNACYLAIPGASSTGHVLIFDTDALITTCSFSAHASALAAIRFNTDGTKLATASEKGTVIRVFSIPNGERLYEFSRGVKRCVTISSLAFSADSRFLCLSSNTETVHIFSLVKSEIPQEQNRLDDQPQEGIGGWVNYFSQQASAYLPTHMNELMLREKSVATARLPIVGTKTTVAMTRINNVDYLLVASTEGYLFCYTVSPESSECALVRQYRIGPNVDQDEIEDANSVISIRAKNHQSAGSSFVPIDTKKHLKENLQAGKSSLSSTSPSPQDLINKSSTRVTVSSSAGSSASAGIDNTKPAPPPIPPAPKKRSESGATLLKTAGSGQMTAMSTNPFEMDENVFHFEDENSGNDNRHSFQKLKPSKGAMIGTISKTSQSVKSSSQRSTKSTKSATSTTDDKDTIVTNNTSDDLLEPLADLNDMEEFPPLAMM